MPDGTPADPPPGPQVLQTEILMVPELPAMVQAVAAVGAQLNSDTDLAILGAGVLSSTIPTGALGALMVGATGPLPTPRGHRRRHRSRPYHPIQMRPRSS